MILRILGSNGTYPTPGRPASGYLVSEDDSVVWMDCGTGTFSAVLETGGVDRVDALVISHGHGDHCLDALPLFNFLRATGRRPLRVLAPQGVGDRLAAFAGAGPDHAFRRLLRFEEVAAGDTAEVGGLSLDFAATAHPVASLAVAVSGDRRLVYSGDTGPGGDLGDLALGADALLCEATLQGEPPPDRYPFHLYAVEAGEIAAAAGVGRLILTHLAPTLDRAVSQAEAAQAYDGPIDLAEAGREYEL